MRVLSFLGKDSTVYLNKSACVCVGSFHSFSKPIILMPVCHSLRITRFDFSLFFFFFFCVFVCPLMPVPFISPSAPHTPVPHRPSWVLAIPVLSFGHCPFPVIIFDSFSSPTKNTQQNAKIPALERPPVGCVTLELLLNPQNVARKLNTSSAVSFMFVSIWALLSVYVVL